MKKHFLIFSLIIIVFANCKNDVHFITDSQYRAQVMEDFEKAKILAINRSEALFGVFNNKMSLKESEALKFLFAYMPLSDLADYDGNFFLDQVKLAFQAKKTFAWGNEIPEDIFRHYVLPYRVNNENLDTARSVFFKELKERLKGLNLEEAALEVNRWCHEKVIYQSTDERTISPLNAVKSAYGRCGEQSTFTVTAMRAACIPARQCYTPRWAHVDDNHAWVEVWINGKWRYLGACEPETKLDVAWFNQPVLRAMLVHSKAFGQYKGEENVDRQYQKYAYLNMLDHYAPVKNLYVKVMDTDGNPVHNADVEYQLYNYAEFYPLSIQKTNKDGICKFTTGFGDLLIWASAGNNYAFQKTTVESKDTVSIILEGKYHFPYSEEMVLVPPISREPVDVLTEEDKAFNNACKLRGDSIRNSFTKSFISENEAFELADKLRLDRNEVWEYLKLSRGNYPEIVKFFEQGVGISHQYTLSQLDMVSKKDVRDAKAETLLGNLKNSLKFEGSFNDKELYLNYVLNPRVGNEMLTDSKTYLTQKLAQNSISSIQTLIDWMKENLRVNEDLNYYQVPITPVGVFELKVTDGFSRNIFFVLACRALGIPARLEPGTKIPQYFENNLWVDAVFDETIPRNRIKGKLVLSNVKQIKFDPLYRIHFSLMKLENGRFNTLDYGWEIPLSKLGNTFLLDTGHYMLLTGNRQPSGTVFANLSFFRIEEGKSYNLKMNFIEKISESKPLGILGEIMGLKNINGTDAFLNLNGPLVFVWLDANMEPSKHALNNIQQMNKELSKNKIRFYFIVNQLNESNKNLLKTYQLPENSTLLIDNGYGILNSITVKTGLKSTNYPVILYTLNNNIYYHSSGYNIGTAEQLLKMHNSLVK
jgi:transglutaminase-like putative cysteine protease